MKTLKLTALAMLAGLAATACQSDGISDPVIMPAPDTPEQEWVGMYVGTANAEVLDESYRDVPFCLELWANDGMLQGSLHVGIPALAEMADDMDDVNPRERDYGCGGAGVIMSAEQLAYQATSRHAVRLTRPIGDELDSDYLWLELDREGDDLIGEVNGPNLRMYLMAAAVH